MSFARHGRSQVQSFPSRPAGGIYSASHWKCAADGGDSSRHCGTGMTSVSKWVPFQMTPPPSVGILPYTIRYRACCPHEEIH